jgi:hypothetical protein
VNGELPATEEEHGKDATAPFGVAGEWMAGRGVGQVVLI